MIHHSINQAFWFIIASGFAMSWQIWVLERSYRAQKSEKVNIAPAAMWLEEINECEEGFETEIIEIEGETLSLTTSEVEEHDDDINSSITVTLTTSEGGSTELVLGEVPGRNHFETVVFDQVEGH